MAFREPFYRWRPHPWHGIDVGLEGKVVIEAAVADYDKEFGGLG